MSVFTRNGIYYTRFRANGKEVVKSTGTRDIKRARAIEADMQVQTLRKSYKTMTLSEAIDRCYEERWFETKRGDETYQRAQVLLEFFGDIPLAEITNERVQHLRKMLLRNGKSPATVNRHMSRLKTVLTMAQERWDVLDKTPYVPQSRETTGRIRIVTQEEEARLLDTLHAWGEKELAVFFVVLIDSGMRLSEGLNLKSKDVDLGNNLIYIWENKTDRPRAVPMTVRVRKYLEERLERETVFNTLNYNRIQYMWDKVRCALGLKDDADFVIHALRHTYASRLVQAGYDLYKIKLLLGHSTIKMTERYAHLLPSSVLDAASVLDKTFNVM